MMKKILNNEKGITLTSLTVVIVLILILTSVLLYNIKDNLRISNLKAMQNDIENLRDKVNEYYAINGAIPAKLKYTNTEELNVIKNAGAISENIDIGDFYIIDLDEIENITLNYGEDFKQITEIMTDEEASEFDDLYIVNKTSQNIFYVAGIKIDNDWFYTDYNKDEIDKEAVNLRYFDGVKIPDGFYYVGGTEQEGIVISDNIEDINKGTSHETAQNLKGNQFVWVPVNKENFDTEFVRREGYLNGTIDKKLVNCGEANETGINDKLAETTTTQNEAQEMYESVKRNGGFYIGRYEAGNSNGNVTIKKGVNVYNNIKWSSNGAIQETTGTTGGAVELSRNFDSANNYTSVTSTLCYGVQWDAVIKWMENIENPNATGTLTKYIQDSSVMGYYSKSAPTITGSNSNFTVKNIYDLAGNVEEWTMELYNQDKRVYRGGNYARTGSYYPMSNRMFNTPSSAEQNIGFRITLYLNNNEKWSKTYDKNGTYKDKNGDVAPIYEGFQVSQTSGMDTVDDGLVIKDKNKNEWVWIEVPKSIYTNAEYNGGTAPSSSTDYGKIESTMQKYANAYRETWYEDIWYSEAQHGFKGAEEYNNHKNSMLKSVYENGGFYIGRYEVGIGEDTIRNYGEDYDTEHPIEETPVIKQDKKVYNWVTCKQAQELSERLATGGKTSSLMFGIQWDLVLKYLETKEVSVSELKKDSSSWGNYYNSTFSITKGEYSEDHGASYKTASVDKPYSKKEESEVLLTTGATERNSKMNIYDLAGNVWEWILEYSWNTNYPCRIRGGSYYNGGSYNPASNRNDDGAFCGGDGTSFRPALW